MEIYCRYSVSVFSCFIIWPERTVPLKHSLTGQELFGSNAAELHL